MDKWWDRPVRIMVSGTTAFAVERLDRAAEILVNEWPAKRGPAYAHAKERLLKAMETPNSDSARAAARMAFEAAAREAGILDDRQPAIGNLQE